MNAWEFESDVCTDLADRWHTTRRPGQEAETRVRGTDKDAIAAAFAEACPQAVDRARDRSEHGARVDDMPWKDIADGKEMVIRSGYRHLQVWKCVVSGERHCLPAEGAGHCGAVHSDWFLPALCLPEKQAVHLEDLVLSGATGESAPVDVPDRGTPR